MSPCLFSVWCELGTEVTHYYWVAVNRCLFYKVTCVPVLSAYMFRIVIIFWWILPSFNMKCSFLTLLIVIWSAFVFQHDPCLLSSSTSLAYPIASFLPKVAFCQWLGNWVPYYSELLLKGLYCGLLGVFLFAFILCWASFISECVYFSPTIPPHIF